MTTGKRASLRFASADAHRAWLEENSALPQGFSVGVASFSFVPYEVPKPARMNVTLLTLDEPSRSFGGLFTRNAYPGGPVVVGRRRLGSDTDASAGDQQQNSECVLRPARSRPSERLCQEVATMLGCQAEEASVVFPDSGGPVRDGQGGRSFERQSAVMVRRSEEDHAVVRALAADI